MKIEVAIPDVAVEGETKVTIAVGKDGITILPEGMGTFDGQYAPILIEREAGRIRLIYWPKINEDEPVIVDMSGALESNSNFAKGHYENGVCPDCQEDIPYDAIRGESCANCGHVWAWGVCDDEPEPELPEEIKNQYPAFDTIGPGDIHYTAKPIFVYDPAIRTGRLWEGNGSYWKVATFSAQRAEGTTSGTYIVSYCRYPK